MKIGILTGSIHPSSLTGSRAVDTGKGTPSSSIYDLDVKDIEYLMIARHSIPPRIPPHMINHRANLLALKEAGATSMISICSTGALRNDIPVPSVAVPEDFIDLSPVQTFFDDSIHHATPSLDIRLRKALVLSAQGSGLPCIDGGVYIQTKGPRLETRAEVRMLSGFGDYVGMNLASEAGLCCELGIPVAGLVTVDNHANGIVEKELDYREILDAARSKWNIVMGILTGLADHADIL
ncbi:MAG: MTAP family purine nucleoside phosphorylase [Candidatus Thermoplasmatota archaeon]|nr:MTAP family purine nucleoside phosphorylase [Candidatus Thermoplasmatota archaeon]